MRELIIHIGYSKCASSSIQSYLTANPEFTIKAKKYNYIGFHENELISCQEIGQKCEFAPRFFTTNISHDLPTLENQLAILEASDVDVGIISNEGLTSPGWLDGDRKKLFANLNVPIRLFMIVRPFTEWLNASWWQWGAFGDISVNDWLSRFSINDYAKGLRNWLDIPNVIEHKVVDLSENPVMRFSNFIGSECEAEIRKNSGSSADMLRFLINHKTRLGRTVHGNLIEFILNEEVEIEEPKAPFILSSGLEKVIIDSYRNRVLDFPDQQFQSLMMAHVDQMEIRQRTRKCGDRGEFSMERFLNEQYNYDFISKISSVLVNRIGVPLNFDPNKYLFLNPDIKAAGVNAYQHYLNFGIKEGRRVE